jgi:hypothetical protein
MKDSLSEKAYHRRRNRRRGSGLKKKNGRIRGRFSRRYQLHCRSYRKKNAVSFSQDYCHE